MLDEFIVIGIVMALVEMIKVALKKVMLDDRVTQLLPLLVLFLAGAVNVANAAVFTPDANLLDALRTGLMLGATAGGIYSLGKAALGKS